LKTLLVQTAWCAVRVKNTYLRTLFVRLKARRGPRKAIIAAAASILTAVYWMLRRGVGYVDLGADHFDRTDRARLAARLARKLGELGFEVSLTQRATVSS
jgi:transposase